MKKLSLTLLVLLMAGSKFAFGATQRIVCPTELPATSIKLVDTPKEWRTYVSSPLYLHSASPTNGPPERLGISIGEEIKRTKTEWTRRYSLEGPYPEGKWLQCDYGMLNEISLSKRLADDTKECTVTGKKGEKAGQNALDIVCK